MCLTRTGRTKTNQTETTPTYLGRRVIGEVRQVMAAEGRTQRSAEHAHNTGARTCSELFCVHG